MNTLQDALYSPNPHARSLGSTGRCLASLAVLLSLQGCGSVEVPLPEGRLPLQVDESADIDAHDTASPDTDQDGSDSTGGALETAGDKSLVDEGGRSKRFAINVENAKNQVTFIDAENQDITASFTRRAKRDWVFDCPMQYAGHDLEVVDLDVETLEFAGIVIERPVLLAGCRGHEVLLRSGPLSEDLGATSCMGDPTCFSFSYARTR